MQTMLSFLWNFVLIEALNGAFFDAHLQNDLLHMENLHFWF